jgi:hypothetical protein
MHCPTPSAPGTKFIPFNMGDLLDSYKGDSADFLRGIHPKVVQSCKVRWLSLLCPLW